MNEKSYFCRFTFGQFFTLLVLEIFTLFFIFYLGARLGDTVFSIPKEEVRESTSPSVDNSKFVQSTQDPEIQALASELVKKSSTPELKQRVSELLQQNATEDFKPKEVKPVEAKKSPYAIQIGSFPTEKEATASSGLWKKKGYSAYVTMIDLPKRGRWYRVRIGGFDDKESAQSYLKDFKERENLEAILVLTE